MSKTDEYARVNPSVDYGNIAVYSHNDVQKMKDKIKELEKENAELKELKKKKEEIEIMTNFCKTCKKMHTDKLAQAKEIIKEIMKYDIPTLDYEKAEQFLKEIEK